ncbi:MAG: CRISPR-associated helicase Cas3', partial [Candidatus Magnetomorum sp.]|nr:CRISPR-associated helicase Cas3' [Candidatus Magnetomorum sp.]
MIISHPATQNDPAKPLKTHLYNVAKRSRDLIVGMQLNLSIITKTDLADLSYMIGLFHDFGKATTFFQNYINQLGRKSPLTYHSFISAFVCFHIIENLYPNQIRSIIAYLVIKKHHANLETIGIESIAAIKNIPVQLTDIIKNASEEIHTIYSNLIPDMAETLSSIDLEDIAETIEDMPDYLGEQMNVLDSDQTIELFFIVNLLFSVLIDTDKKDAARLENQYFQDNLKEPLNDVFAYLYDCQAKDLKKFSPEVPINALRNKFLNDIIHNDQIKAENHFYTITAPTGIGKTFGCLAFANQLIQKLPEGKARIIYCLPYTSIIDQNHAEFERIIRFVHKEAYDDKPERYLLKHHHLSHKIIRNRVSTEINEISSYKDYLDDCLFVESWESAFIVTTFVQFFETIIGHRNRLLKKLHNIVNSVVILDEVQNIDPEYYQLLRHTLDVFGKRFNTYFLLITATQPEILDIKKSGCIELIDSKQYMKHSLFNRVDLKIIKKGQSIDTFIQDFCHSFSDQNTLIVLNTKKSAIKVFQELKAKIKSYKFVCLTTLLTPGDRKRKISQIKQAIQNNEHIIVVSTQLIEAGVDLSFKTVYRDFGPVDSIIQVAGRCNRNGEYGINGGKMIVVRLYNDKNVYYHSQVYPSILSQYVEKTLIDDSYKKK